MKKVAADLKAIYSANTEADAELNVELKVISLAMRNITTKCTMPVREWKPALNHVAVECAERLPR